MRTLKTFICLATLFIFVACDRDESYFMVTPQSLFQTAWDCELVSYPYNRDEHITQTFIIEFLTTNSGYCIYPEYEIILDFQYDIEENIIYFNGGRLLPKEWFIVEATEKRIKLSAYSSSSKDTLTLNRIQN